MISLKEKIRFRFISFLFAFSLIISTSYASYTILGFTTDVDWVLISYLVILCVAILLGIAYMVSKVFAIRELEAWSKDEFMNLLLSAGILILFTMFVGITDQIANSLAKDILYSTASSKQSGMSYWQYIPNEGRWKIVQTSNPSCPYPCHIYIARGFLGSLYEIYGDELRSLSQYYFLSVFYSTQSIGTGFDFTLGRFKFNFGVGFPLHADLTIYNNILAVIISEYLKIITAIKMQEVTLVYITSLAGIFFLLGIISRSIWFLRKFGGLFVAAGIGLYFIFPMMYVLSWYTIDKSVVSLQLDEIKPLLGEDPVSYVTRGIGGLGDISMMFTKYDKNGVPISIGLLDALGRAYISVIVIPLLAIFTTIGFIRHFSPMIGGDTEIAGITRII